MSTSEAIKNHPNYVSPYGIVTKETVSKTPWVNHEKHKEYPKRTSKKERRTLRTI